MNRSFYNRELRPTRIRYLKKQDLRSRQNSNNFFNKMNDKSLNETAVANFSEAMEVDTISKNGRSSKSHTSRIYRNANISMKKFFAAAIVTAFMSGLVSCSKDSLYQCECTFSVLGSTVKVESFEDTSKKECQEAEDAGNESGAGLVKVNCVVK